MLYEICSFYNVILFVFLFVCVCVCVCSCCLCVLFVCVFCVLCIVFCVLCIVYCVLCCFCFCFVLVYTYANIHKHIEKNQIHPSTFIIPSKHMIICYFVERINYYSEQIIMYIVVMEIALQETKYLFKKIELR
jgi:hypothetical protein